LTIVSMVPAFPLQRASSAAAIHPPQANSASPDLSGPSQKSSRWAVVAGIVAPAVVPDHQGFT